MTEENVFSSAGETSGDNPFDHQSTSSTTDTSTEGYVEKLVGEGKKFSDVEALARGKLESDKFIENLKREMQELREELTKQDYASELMNKLSSPQQQEDNKANTSSEGHTDPKNLSTDDVEALVKEYISKQEKERSAAENLRTVSEKLTAQFGEKTREVIASKSKELGLPVEEMESMAAKSPTAFLKLMDASSTTNAPGSSIPNSSVNTQTNEAGSRQVRDWNYYQDLRRKSRTEYFKPSTQRQMLKDMEALGDKFGMPR